MQPLDPTIVALAKAIRQTESGGNFQAKGVSGEYGAYQFLPTTFANLSQKYLGQKIDLQKATPEQQNEVAYKQIADWKAQGFNVGQVASAWNAGPGEKNAYTGTFSNGKPAIGTNSYGAKFDVPTYAKNVATAYQTFKGQMGGTQQPIAPQQNNGVAFPSSPTDTGLTAGLKAIGNTPQSALNFAKGAIQTVNPLETANKIGQIGTGFQQLSQQEGTGQAILDIIKGLPKAAYETLVPSGIRSLLGGDVQGAAKAFTEDPFGQAAPLVLGAEGAAKLADTYGGGLAKAAENNVANFSKTGINVMPKEGVYSQNFGNVVSGIAKPVLSATDSLTQIPSTIARSVVSHLTSLDPETISAIVSDPKSFSRLQQEATSRASVAESFGQSIDEMIKQKGETGAEYNNIRSNATPVEVPQNFIPKVLNESGLKVVDGKIVADSNSITRNPADIKALQNFYDNWGDKQTLTPNEYLNMRKDIQGIAKFGKDVGTNPDAQIIGKKLYDEANKTIRPSIKGLKELDAKMSPQIEQYKQIKKDFLNSDGTFKDGAMNKIANALGKGKDNLLARMENISPGITKSIQVLKAIEDIQRANGIKVGSYIRSLVEGGGIVTGNIPLIITAILTNPKIAVQILRGFGITGNAVLPVIKILQDLSGGAKNYSTVGLAKNQNEKK